MWTSGDDDSDDEAQRRLGIHESALGVVAWDCCKISACAFARRTSSESSEEQRDPLAAGSNDVLGLLRFLLSSVLAEQTKILSLGSGRESRWWQSCRQALRPPFQIR